MTPIINAAVNRTAMALFLLFFFMRRLLSAKTSCFVYMQTDALMRRRIKALLRRALTPLRPLLFARRYRNRNGILYHCIIFEAYRNLNGIYLHIITDIHDQIRAGTIQGRPALI